MIRVKESRFAQEQSTKLAAQVKDIEIITKQNSELTMANVQKMSDSDLRKSITEKKVNVNASLPDDTSHFSLRTGFSNMTSASEVGKLTKENIIYHKYV